MSYFKALALLGTISAVTPQMATAAPFDGSPQELQKARAMCKKQLENQTFNNKDERQMAFQRCVQSQTIQRRAK